jgi:hypothetical protein
MPRKCLRLILNQLRMGGKGYRHGPRGTLYDYGTPTGFEREQMPI